MKYKVNQDIVINTGFTITPAEILQATETTNNFLTSLPASLFKRIDFKTTGAMIGAIYCSNIEEIVAGCVTNPIEKGYPDLIPREGLNAPEAVLRNYPKGLEIKGTIGNVTSKSSLRAGEQRIDAITGITWQAHHREVNNLLGLIWDYANPIKNFNFPAITAAFFSNQLTPDDWGAISGTTGRNTKVSGMNRSGKAKMGNGLILIYDDPVYTIKYGRFM